MDKFYLKKLMALEEEFTKNNIQFLVNDSSHYKSDETFRIYLEQLPLEKQKFYISLNDNDIFFVNLISGKQIKLGNLNNLQDFNYQMIKLYVNHEKK